MTSVRRSHLLVIALIGIVAVSAAAIQFTVAGGGSARTSFVAESLGRPQPAASLVRPALGAKLEVAHLDEHGKDVTPAGLRWKVKRDRGAEWLELRLDDARLPVPYVIDPIALVGTCPGTFPGNYNGCSVQMVSNRKDFTGAPLVR